MKNKAQEKRSALLKELKEALLVAGTIKVIYHRSPAIIRHDLKDIRREAALERKLAAAEREIERLKQYQHDPRVEIVPRDPRWDDDVDDDE